MEPHILSDKAMLYTQNPFLIYYRDAKFVIILDQYDQNLKFAWITSS